MEKLPSVSVIIPVFNGGAALKNCLKALKAQTYTGQIEIVVVNDGSTDESSRVAKTFKGIILIEQENKGRAVARNRGLFCIYGEIIAFTEEECFTPA